MADIGHRVRARTVATCLKFNQQEEPEADHEAPGGRLTSLRVGSIPATGGTSSPTHPRYSMPMQRPLPHNLLTRPAVDGEAAVMKLKLKSVRGTKIRETSFPC